MEIFSSQSPCKYVHVILLPGTSNFPLGSARLSSLYNSQFPSEVALDVTFMLSLGFDLELESVSGPEFKDKFDPITKEINLFWLLHLK